MADNELTRRLERFNATFAEFRALFERMGPDDSDGLNPEAVQALRDIAAANRDIRTEFAAMTDAERAMILAQSSDPQLLKAFFDVLRLK